MKKTNRKTNKNNVNNVEIFTVGYGSIKSKTQETLVLEIFPCSKTSQTTRKQS